MSQTRFSYHVSSGAISDALLARCGDDSPSGTWKVAAASAGVAGADAFLCHLSRSISGALDELAASAEASRARVVAAHDAVAIEAQPLFDELEVLIESAAASKRAALEREICAVDAALENLRAARSAVAEAVATLSGTELKARHAELTARLDAADAQLLALPTTVIEPPYVGVVVDEAALLAGAAVFGRVVAPRAITAADLTLEGAPSYAYPGCTAIFRLVSNALWLSTQSADELVLSLGAAAVATHIEASLKAQGAAAPKSLQADAAADVPKRCIVVSIAVPLDTPVGSSVFFGHVTVSGQPVAGLLGPVRVEPPGPANLSPEHAAQLQAWLPPHSFFSRIFGGGTRSPSEWREVYRATTHGFGARAFHERCDGRARLLILVRSREGGWLFGGFTAVGFSPPGRWIKDPCAFLFSLTNSLGRPEKLESKGVGKDLLYNTWASATFGGSHPDLYICENADTETGSWTHTGGAFAASTSTGAHPMAQGYHEGWFAAEFVAWVV